MITKEEFQAYEDVRLSGRTNMFMVSNVIVLSGLDRETIKEIMSNYSEIKDSLSQKQKTTSKEDIE